MLGEFNFGFSPSLGEAVASKNIQMTKYKDKDRKIAWIQIDGSFCKIIDYSVLQEIKSICLKSWITIISPCSNVNRAMQQNHQSRDKTIKRMVQA